MKTILECFEVVLGILLIITFFPIGFAARFMGMGFNAGWDFAENRIDDRRKWRMNNGTTKKKENKTNEDESLQEALRPNEAVDVQSQGKTKVD